MKNNQDSINIVVSHRIELDNLCNKKYEIRKNPNDSPNESKNFIFNNIKRFINSFHTKANLLAVI